MSVDDDQWQRFRLLPALQRPSYDKLPQKMTLDLASTTQTEKTVVLFNSEAHHRHEMVRLKTSWPYVRVLDPEGRKIRHQVNPVWTLQHHQRLEHAPETVPDGLPRPTDGGLLRRSQRDFHDARLQHI